MTLDALYMLNRMVLDSGFGLTHAQFFCWGCVPALLQEDPGVHQAGAFIFLSKSSFPGTRYSPDLYQMNVAAEV